MHEKSLEMGIEEAQIDTDDSPEAGGKQRIQDPSVRLSIAMILAATFFYYMSYNAMTTNISRYANMFFGMAGGSYAIINIVTIAGGLLSYVPIANLSLKYGRKRMAVITSFVMVAGSAINTLFRVLQAFFVVSCSSAPPFAASPAASLHAAGAPTPTA